MRALRPGRGIRAALAAALIVFLTIAAVRLDSSPIPEPPRLDAVRADTLADRYDANHRYIADAARAARQLGDDGRAQRLAAFDAPGRQFLSFDARGDGQAVEVLGDLARADHVVVMVPGSDTTLDTYDHFGAPWASLHGAAESLSAETRRLDPDGKVAVVAWFGYPAPRTLSTDIVTTSRAEDGGPRLRSLLGSVRKINPSAQVAMLCHSYGTAVCASALSGTADRTRPNLKDVAFLGSPGVIVRSASDLRTSARVWAGRGAQDWIAGVPHTSVAAFGVTVGLGTDPTSYDFGARDFGAGAGGHSDYFKPGSAALRHLALIGIGKDPKAAHV